MVNRVLLQFVDEKEARNDRLQFVDEEEARNDRSVETRSGNFSNCI